MSDLISAKELYSKLAKVYNKGLISWGSNEIFKDIIGECIPYGNTDKIDALMHDISVAVYQISVALVSVMDSEDPIYHLHFENQYKMAKKYIEDFEREEDPELVEQLKGGKK
jgi:hypothetical protein